MRYIYDNDLPTLKEVSLDLENKLAVRSFATVSAIIVAGDVLPVSKPEAMLVSYITCPVADCSAIVIPAIEKLAQARRFDLLTRAWSLRCPRCSMQFSVAESELKQANIRLERIRQDYPYYKV